MSAKPQNIFDDTEERSVISGDNNAIRQVPYNLEAEQQLLGSLLINNEWLGRVSEKIRAEYFYEGVHSRIYEAIVKLLDRGQIANPITLKHYFDKDEALAAVGGGDYLVKLAETADIVSDIRQYAVLIEEQALSRKLIDIGTEIVANGYEYDIDRPVATSIEQAEQQLFHLAGQGSSERDYKSLMNATKGALAFAEQAFKNPGAVSGTPSGFNDLDSLLGGLQNSDLIILAGRPSMGKTAFATNVAYNVCQFFYNKLQEEQQENADGANQIPNNNKPRSVGFFSLEMSSEQLAARMLSCATGINASKLRSGQMTPEEFSSLVTASRDFGHYPFYIDDTPAISISALRTRARRMQRKHNLGLIIVDYLQLVRGGNNSSQQGRVQEISEVTQGLKAIAKELDVPVIALSQLSRAVEQRDDKRPMLSDLRESGSIEQDADIVMFVFREEYYLARRMPREGTEHHMRWQSDMEAVHGIAELIVAKHRHGPIGTAKLQFQSDTTRFHDLYSEGDNIIR